jgi:hypothetical protein
MGHVRRQLALVALMVFRGSASRDEHDVTSSKDPNGHRILKSHLTGPTKENATVAADSGSTLPGLTGPMAIKITDSIDLLPA